MNLFSWFFLRRIIPNEPHDACRVYGSLTLNKVAGNFHITAGKSVPLLRGHAHLTAFMDKVPEPNNGESRMAFNSLSFFAIIPKSGFK